MAFYDGRRLPYATLDPQTPIHVFRESRGSSDYLVRRLACNNFRREFERAKRTLVGQIDGNHDRDTQGNPQNRQTELPRVPQRAAEA